MAIKYRIRIEELEARVRRLEAENILLEKRAERAEVAAGLTLGPLPAPRRRRQKKDEA